MHNTGAWWNYLEISERFLTPFKESISLAVSGELKSNIQLEGICGSEVIDLNRVINHEFGRLKGIDRVRIASHPLDPIPHGSKIHNRRYTGEILK
jgi:hypothetical protein